MDDQNNKIKTTVLKDIIIAKGAYLVGFADISCLKLSITQVYPYAICFCLRHDDSVVDKLPNDEVWEEMSYSLTEKARDIYGEIQTQLSAWNYTYSRTPSTTKIDELPVPGEELPQKTIATLSGLGWIGKSSLLITPEYGPRVRFGALLTDMPLDTNTPITQSKCGDCRACVDNCPVNAIHGNSWNQTIPRSELLDVPKCYSHLWSKKEATGRRSLCGLCLKVCPFGQ